MKVTKSRKFCFFMPLKPALLLISYLRSLICIVTVTEFTLHCIGLFKRLKDSYEDAVIFMECVASVIPQLLDLIFIFVYILALHRGNINLQEVYYYYSITMTTIYFLVVVLLACDMERFKMLYYMVFQYTWFVDLGYFECIVCGGVAIVLQMYVTYLVRCGVKNKRSRLRLEIARQRSSISFRGMPKLITNV